VVVVCVCVCVCVWCVCVVCGVWCIYMHIGTGAMATGDVCVCVCLCVYIYAYRYGRDGYRGGACRRHLRRQTPFQSALSIDLCIVNRLMCIARVRRRTHVLRDSSV
jgi:hypothetical protein